MNKIEQKNTKEKIPLDMYAISGHSANITNKIVARYLNCEKQKDFLEFFNYPKQIEKIKNAKPEDKAILIEQLFDFNFYQKSKGPLSNIISNTTEKEKEA